MAAQHGMALRLSLLGTLFGADTAHAAELMVVPSS
jgi:hypothetical protein